MLSPHARGRLGPLCRGYADRAVLVTDAELSRTTPHPKEAAQLLSFAGVHIETVTLPTLQLGTVESARTIHDRGRDMEARLYIALGGGSVMDAAKTAAAAHCEPWILDTRMWQRPTGLLQLRGARACADIPTLVAVPTRPGSAAEVAPRAALAPDAAHTRRLLTGPALVPTAAVVDPHWSASLSRTAWLTSITEILFRVLGPFLVTRRSTRSLDRAAAKSIDMLLDLGMDVARRGDADPGQRLTAAELSIATATADHVRHWSPAMPAWWCIQNTLSTRTGRPKGELTARAMPLLLERIAQGDARLGSADRLRRLEKKCSSGLIGRLSDFCATVEKASGTFPEPQPHADLTAWAREIGTLWNTHPGINHLGIGGIRDLLRGIGL